jgi:hypothetical protein
MESVRNRHPGTAIHDFPADVANPMIFFPATARIHDPLVLFDRSSEKAVRMQFSYRCEGPVRLKRKIKTLLTMPGENRPVIQ